METDALAKRLGRLAVAGYESVGAWVVERVETNNGHDWGRLVEALKLTATVDAGSAIRIGHNEDRKNVCKLASGPRLNLNFPSRTLRLVGDA